jgi:thiosulfate reductase cytochrome b subunit
MSPAFNSAVPAANVQGERRSARGLHFFVPAFLLLFRIIHIEMRVLGGGCSFPREIRFQWEVVYDSQG